MSPPPHIVRQALKAGQHVVVDIRPYSFTHILAFADDCGDYGGSIHFTNAAQVPPFKRQQMAKDAQGRMTFED
ncbi:MAG: hypothetical protein AB1942_18655 [Pseudomonadota bacterium]